MGRSFERLGGAMKMFMTAFAWAMKAWRALGERRARTRTAAVVGLCAALAACSGGVSDDPATGAPPPVSVVSVAVADAFGAPVAGATVTATLGGVSVSGPTDAQGVVLLPVNGPSGSASVVVERPSFDDAVVTVPVTAGDVNTVAVTLDRTTAAAGGSLPVGSGGGTGGGGAPPVTVGDGRTRLSFEVELVVVDGGGRPIGTLGAGDFALLPCAPDAAREGDECMVGGDRDYTAVTAAPESLQLIPSGTAAPFAAVLLMDQSASIAQSDPTNARLFAAKSMLSTLGPDDQTLLAAFAALPNALIPTAPLSVYLPVRGRDDARAYFGDLDALGPLLGGNTPLYTSIDAVVAQIAADPAVPADKALAVVVFTDGRDNECGNAEACLAARERTIAQALANEVRLFTIGLSDQADTGALGELAQRTGGALLFAQTPEQLTPLYGSIGALLGRGAPTYRVRWTVETDAAGGFPAGGQLLGRVRVDADGSSFELPIVVAIP